MSRATSARCSSGMVDLALGTDTAGSGRVPAGANGIVTLAGWIAGSPATHPTR